MSTGERIDVEIGKDLVRSKELWGKFDSTIQIKCCSDTVLIPLIFLEARNYPDSKIGLSCSLKHRTGTVYYRSRTQSSPTKLIGDVYDKCQP